MPLVIKKTIDLSSLGDEYSGINLIFKSIPASKLIEYEAQQDRLAKDKNDIPLATEATPYIIGVLKKQFIEGSQNSEELQQDDIDQLDTDALVYCFQILTGQIIDPKVPSESTTTSSTNTDIPQK